MMKLFNTDSFYPATTEFVGVLSCRRDLANEARSDRAQALARRCIR